LCPLSPKGLSLGSIGIVDYAEADGGRVEVFHFVVVVIVVIVIEWIVVQVWFWIWYFDFGFGGERSLSSSCSSPFER